MVAIQTISRYQLEERLAARQPDNEDRENGYALVNVLSPRMFEREHIPGSINIPGDALEEFEKRFAKSKEIIVYCASFDCDASPTATAKLQEKGFEKVFDYEGGMNDWKEGGNRVVGPQAKAS